MVARRWLSSVVFLLGAMLLLLQPATAWTQTATLKGKVTDAATGTALPGANVVLTSAGGASTGAASDGSGNYVVKGLAAGTYTVTATYIGYEKKVVANVTLAAGASETLDLAITPSGISFDALVVSASRVEEKILEAPAAISVLEAADLRQVVAPSSQAILTNVTGVDMSKTGIDREEIVLRGFNNAFSGAAYVLTDYRQAAVASLAVNIHSIMPNIAIDLDRVEVVRGPGSALYGAGVDAGVIHYFTKNPFSYPGTTVSIGGGERALYNAAFRHAGVLGRNLGYKITGQFAQAEDWKLDANDELDRFQLASDKEGFTRNYDYNKYNLNGLLQYRFTDRVSLTASGGYSSTDATVLSGIGTVQAEDFGYTYGQLRFQAGSFFAQTYLNRNNAGDSFVYGSGQNVVDNSTLFNAQAQYDFMLANRHKVIVGTDWDLITPDTEGTIYGRNEDDDQISEIGAYFQSTSNLTSKFDLTLALRTDYNNVQEDVQLSPRLALVFKANPQHTFRATYNRAFSSPGNNSSFLDVVAREPDAALPIRIRGRGAAHGFTFEHNSAYTAIAGTDLVATSLNPATLGAPQPVGLPLADVYSTVHAGLTVIPIPVLKSLLPAPLNQLPDAQIAGLVNLLSPTQTTVSGFSRGALGMLNPTTREINPVSGVTDVEPIKATITQNVELGYKGLLQDRVLVAVDAYYANKKNFVGPLMMETPFVLVPNLNSDLAAALAQGITNNATLAATLGAAGISPAQAAQLIVGLAAQNPSFPKVTTPVAIVVPRQNSVGPGQAPELLLSYRNFGNIDFWGIDASVQVMASNRLNLFGNVSYVSDDFFDNEELDEAGTDLELALNATSFKAKAGFSYAVPLGISFNASTRFIKGFPVRSGPYNGDVEDYTLVDAGVGYDLGRFAHGMTIDVSVQNVLDNKHREFIGAPKVGRLAMARLNYTF